MGLSTSSNRGQIYEVLDDVFYADRPGLKRANVFHQMHVYQTNSVGLPILFYGGPGSGKSRIIYELTNELQDFRVDAGDNGETIRCHVIPTEHRANVTEVLKNNEYRFTALVYVVDVSQFHQGTRGDNPITQAMAEVQTLANTIRMKEMPIIVLLSRRDQLKQEMRTHKISDNFPDFPENGTEQEALLYFQQKFKRIRDTTYRAEYYRSYYVFMPDTFIIMTLFTYFYNDHLKAKVTTALKKKKENAIIKKMREVMNA